jgi:hypothetical protein
LGFIKECASEDVGRVPIKSASKHEIHQASDSVLVSFFNKGAITCHSSSNSHSYNGIKAKKFVGVLLPYPLYTSEADAKAREPM